MDDIGNRIKYLRETNKMTQADLSNKIGLGAASIGGYERGENEPPISVLKKIAYALGVKITYFLEETPLTPEERNLTFIENKLMEAQKELDREREEKEKAKQEAYKYKEELMVAMRKLLGFDDKQ